MERRTSVSVGGTLAVVAAGTLLAMVSYTAPLVPLRAIAGDLGAGPAGQAWILSSTSLGFTAALLTCGTLGDDHGRRRMFTIGAVLLALSSVLGAVAPGTLLFVVGRVLQGIGSAAVIACSLALISHAVPPGPRRATATGLWGAALAAGIALGPLVSAALPWRVTYAVVAVAWLVLAVAARLVLTESTSGVERPLDLVGMVLFAAGLAALLAALTESRQAGAGVFALVLAVVGVALLVWFGLHERRSPHPMVAPGLFASPALVAVTVAALVTGLGAIALMSYLPAMMQRAYAAGPMTTALVLLAWSGTSVVTALLTRRISEQVSGGVRLVGGLLVVAVGLALLITMTPTSPTWLPVLALVVAGLGTGVLNATLGRESVATVPAHQAGMGSGINNTSRYLGAAIGVTVVSVLSSPTGHEDAGRLLAGWGEAAVFGVAATVLGAVVVLVCERRAARAAAAVDSGVVGA